MFGMFLPQRRPPHSRPGVRLRIEQLEDRRLLAADFSFRTLDGTDNHPLDLGAADTNLLRIAPAAYPGDGSGATIVEPPGRTNPRVISNTVVDQAGASVLNDRQLSDFVWQWGQFLDHDIDLTPTNAANGTADIPVAAGDILGPAPIPFHRADFDPATGTPGVPRQQVNVITAFIDASNVYGSDPVRAADLRTFVDGKLRTTAAGRLLPVAGGEFLAGDVRANEQVGLTAMHTLFVREHNRLAEALGNIDQIDAQAADAGMTTDEYIYQVARKIVGAEMQIITYGEFLPALLGPSAPAAAAASHSSSVNPSIANEFATALFRVGHTMLSPQLLLVDQEHAAESLELKHAFFVPEFLGGPDLGNPADTGNVERLLKGLAFQQMQEIDATIVDDVRNFLFGPPGAGGLDLASLNIQRGRDHGLPDYNSLRIAYGLAAKTTILDPGDGSGITGNPAVAARLAAAYGNDVNNIDAWLGALAEDRLPGGSTGELVTAALVDQFVRLRDGDRFFYYHDADLSHEIVSQVIDLDEVTLARVIQANTDIRGLQENVFLATGAVVHEGTLRIHGTGAADRVVVRQLGADRLLVKAGFLPGGKKVFAADGIERVEVLVFDGPDTVIISHRMPATIAGGRGNDKLVGGRGNDRLYGDAGHDTLRGTFGSDILLGGPGNDLLFGGPGRDVVIGGSGRDLALGTAGDDLLIGGTTTFDAAAAALEAVRAEWDSGRDYATRVQNIRGTGSGPDFAARHNGNVFLVAGVTVHDDAAVDVLFGGSGRDWYFFAPASDVVLALAANEEFDLL